MDPVRTIVIAKDKAEYDDYVSQWNVYNKKWFVNDFVYVGDEGEPLNIAGIRSDINTILTGDWYKRNDLQHIAEAIRGIMTGQFESL